MSTLEIRGLTVTVDVEDGTKEILRGVDLTATRSTRSPAAPSRSTARTSSR
jgi:hypothetical protein